MKYTVVLEPQEEGGFAVRCVEIPGAISQGETRKEALANIKEAIELVLEVQRDETVYPPESAIRPEYIRKIKKGKDKISKGEATTYRSMDDFIKSLTQ